MATRDGAPPTTAARRVFLEFERGGVLVDMARLQMYRIKVGDGSPAQDALPDSPCTFVVWAYVPAYLFTTDTDVCMAEARTTLREARAAAAVLNEAAGAVHGPASTRRVPGRPNTVAVRIEHGLVLVDLDRLVAFEARGDGASSKAASPPPGAPGDAPCGLYLAEHGMSGVARATHVQRMTLATATAACAKIAAELRVDAAPPPVPDEAPAPAIESAAAVSSGAGATVRRRVVGE